MVKLIYKTKSSSKRGGFRSSSRKNEKFEEYNKFWRRVEKDRSILKTLEPFNLEDYKV